MIYVWLSLLVIGYLMCIALVMSWSRDYVFTDWYEYVVFGILIVFAPITVLGIISLGAFR